MEVDWARSKKAADRVSEGGTALDTGREKTVRPSKRDLEENSGEGKTAGRMALDHTAENSARLVPVESLGYSFMCQEDYVFVTSQYHQIFSILY